MKLAAICAVCAILCSCLKRFLPDHAAALSILCCIGAVCAAASFLGPVVTFLETLQNVSGLNHAVFSPLLKTAAIGMLTELSGAFCQDAGEQALAKTVTLCGSILVLYTALPLASRLLELLEDLMLG